MYEILFLSRQPKAKDFRRHCYNVFFPHVWQKLTKKIQEEHQQAIPDCDNQIQAHQQRILRLNQKIDDLIKKRHVAFLDILTMCCASLKRTAKRPTHITLFDVNIGSLKNIRDVLNFVTQAWRRLPVVMIQIPFINGTYSSAK